jgi:hypothetical protein
MSRKVSMNAQGVIQFLRVQGNSVQENISIKSHAQQGRSGRYSAQATDAKAHFVQRSFQTCGDARARPLPDNLQSHKDYWAWYSV